jgi:hypothetical protein
VGLSPKALLITIFVLCGQHFPTFLPPFPTENPLLTLFHSLLAMVLGVFHLMKERILSLCLEVRSKGGVDGADAGVVDFFFCMCFELDDLALADK